MLSPGEERGQFLKRYVRAAAALNNIYDDTTLADEVGVQRGAVRSWWDGAQMKPDTLRHLAETTSLSPDELMAFVYNDGPPPSLDRALLPILEGVRRAQARLAGEAPGTPPQPPERRPRDTGVGRG